MNATRTTDSPPDAAPAVPTRLILAYGLIALVAIAYWPASTALYHFWTDVENLGGTHGLLLLAMSLWLLFRIRHTFAALDARPSALGFAALFACSLAWLILFRAGLEDLHLLLLPPLAGFAVYAAFGRKAAFAVAFPIGLLFLAMPAWGHLAEPLQALTTRAVGLLATISGVPVFVERNFVTIPEGVFEVAGGCSGVHFLVVGIALSALYGEITGASLRRRVVLVGSMVAIALVVNWVRVFSIVVAGHLTNMQHSLITHGHYWFGWTLFAVSVFVFIWVASRSDPPPVTTSAPSPSPEASRPYPLAAAALLLLAMPATAYVADPANTTPSVEAPAHLPTGRDPWSGPGVSPDSWRPVFTGAHQQVQAVYRDARGATVEVAGIVYRTQRQGAELVGEGSRLLGDGDFPIQSERVASEAAGEFREVVFTDGAGARFVIWSVYDINGHHFVVPLQSQLWYGARSIFGSPVSSLLAARTPCEPSCDLARARLGSFLNTMGSDLLRALAEPARATGSGARTTGFVP